MRTGIVAGAEVLSRWHHEQSGWVPPMEFVQLAEESGLNFELGRNVIEAAMEQLRNWRLAGYEPIPVSINVSPTLLTDERLPDLIQEVMTATGTPPELIEIEITETVLLRREEAAEVALGKLKAMGLSVALDDFGTGYSALTHLQRFPVDVIKIDRSFIDALDTERGQAIVRGVISMAHAMHLRVVAEGVETIEQRSFLAQEGCDEEQGYLISKPVPALEFEGLFWPNGVAPIMADFESDEGA
jgi:EAL domain-containing protein (putative c-di-GMP-specific phosphodiesterase class I)